MARFITRTDGKTVNLEKEEADQTDVKAKARTTIEIEHSKVHQGKFYFVTDYDTSVDTASPKYWHVKTPDSATRIHCVLAITTNLGAVIEMFENPTLTGNGTALTVNNADRNSANTSSCLFYYDPTASADGTLLQKDRTGTYQPVTRLGGHIRQATEFILKQNTSYLVKVTPDADDTEVSFNAEFYEV